MKDCPKCLAKCRWCNMGIMREIELKIIKKERMGRYVYVSGCFHKKCYKEYIKKRKEIIDEQKMA
jgi:hydrogenase maturation factor